MGKVITDDGVTIESIGDTLKISGIPNDDRHRYALLSMRYVFESQNKHWPAGAWKKIVNGEVTYSMKDRGAGDHSVFIGITPAIESHPTYTTTYVYQLSLTEDNKLTFPRFMS